MAHEERIGHGTQFHRSSDGTSGGTFAKVGRVRDLTPPALSRDPVESTDMESEDRWREFIGGLKDGGELNFEITFDPGSTETTDFMSDLNTDEPGYYKIIFPSADEWGFSALMTGFEPTTPVGEKMTASVTFKVSGKPGWIA